jgi:hypothetical protein
MSPHQMLRHIFQTRGSIPTQDCLDFLIPLKVMMISILSHTDKKKKKKYIVTRFGIWYHSVCSKFFFFFYMKL